MPTPRRGEAYIVKNKRGQQIGSQITHDGSLLIDASVRPHGSATYYVSIGKPYQQKVYATGALYKIRKDDIAWENDRCAYRVYGPAPAEDRRAFLRHRHLGKEHLPDTVVYKRYVKDMNGNIKSDKIDAKVRALQKQEKALESQARNEKNKAKAANREPAEGFASSAQVSSGRITRDGHPHLLPSRPWQRIRSLLVWVLPWDWVHQA